jgi:hypothetical protein
VIGCGVRLACFEKQGVIKRRHRVALFKPLRKSRPNRSAVNRGAVLAWRLKLGSSRKKRAGTSLICTCPRGRSTAGTRFLYLSPRNSRPPTEIFCLAC